MADKEFKPYVPAETGLAELTFSLVHGVETTLDQRFGPGDFGQLRSRSIGHGSCLLVDRSGEGSDRSQRREE